jgi:hypothetical protein
MFKVNDKRTNLTQIQRKNARNFYQSLSQMAEHYGLNPMETAFGLSLQYCFGFR